MLNLCKNSRNKSKKTRYSGIDFNDKNDYNKILEDDKLSILGLDKFKPSEQLTCETLHSDGTKDIIKVNHTYNNNQIEWFKAGSALNLIVNKHD